MKPPRVLIVAGSDSGGGAGIQADIKTVTMLGGHAMTAVTAITAQNTVGVTDVFPLPDEIVRAQISAVLDDLGVDSVKVGMLGAAHLVLSVRGALHAVPPGTPIVVDPVMIATSGAALNERGTADALPELFDMATLITPNVPELEALTGRPVRGEEAMLTAARLLAKRHACAVLAKGGHLSGPAVVDLLVEPAGSVVRWEDARIDTVHTHGTGCTLASGIATELGRGSSLRQAIERSRLFVRLALREAPGFGAGHGPMGHQSVRLDLPDPSGPTLNQMTLPASDYRASVAFYRLLGCRQIVASPPRYARFEVPGGMTLSIEVREPPDPPSTTEHFFQCEDVDAEVRRLAEAGIAFDVMPEDRDYLWRVAETRDPHGNRICLYSTGEIRRYPPWRIDQSSPG